jgi:small subunit ribosomal protein S2
MRAIQLYASGIADAVLEGRSATPEVNTGEDEFVELDEEGKPKPKGAGAPAPQQRRGGGGKAATVKKKGPTRRRDVDKDTAVEPVEDVVAAELDDLGPDVAPEEVMARRREAVAKHKPGTPAPVAAAPAAPAAPEVKAD